MAYNISVVIPVYKAEDCLHELCRRLKESLEKISSNFEIIMVEDCGDDCSWEIIAELARADKRVKGIKFSRNFGQHYAITAGLDYCNGDWVVVMDCDLQDRPEEIPKLYAKAQEGYDMVLTKRWKRKDWFFKRFTSWLFYKLFSYLTGLDHDEHIGNFRIISRKVAESFRLMRERLRFFGGLTDWMGFTTTSIAVQHDKSFHGKSTYTFKKLLKLAGETIIAYSDKPLMLSIKLGFAMSFCAFFSGGYIILRAIIYGSPVVGWSSLMVSLYLIGGIIIAILGIIGIYLGKTFDETKKRPLYIIKSHTENGNI